MMKLLKKFLAEELHITDGKVFEDFIEYNKYLYEWNSKVNVISRKNDSIENIVLNSVYFLTKFTFNPGAKVLDIGTGGGFPGIPLKIIFPEIDITLCDSIRKKINVVDDVIKQMGLSNAEALCTRAEELKYKKKYNRKFDYVVSKSVAPLDNLFKWGRGVLNSSGVFLCVKGGDMTEEVEDLLKRNRDAEAEVIDFTFAEEYNIEEKKLVIIKIKRQIV
ncbi:MAG: 16S rRNA (guanine(527)-N(7))-methyltransferase RsmG [Ignavibacteriota bacterium]|nr:16S rRNA (guanine(527)-N(7))-methyltransferase RsmG [Ignavibacteriota bacterium]